MVSVLSASRRIDQGKAFPPTGTQQRRVSVLSASRRIDQVRGVGSLLRACLGFSTLSESKDSSGKLKQFSVSEEIRFSTLSESKDRSGTWHLLFLLLSNRFSTLSESKDRSGY